MIMKMHSYMNINGYLATIDAQSKAVLARLRKLTDTVGGWDAAIAAAESRRRAIDASSEDEAPTNDKPVPTSSTSESTLRKRSKSNSLRSPHLSPANIVNATQIITTGNHVLPASHVLKPGPHPLVDHPDEAISSLAKEYSELESELVGMGPEYIRWPDNITYKRFAYYMLVPTLVYELEYPTTDRYVSGIVKR